MKAKVWLTGWLIIVLSALCVIGYQVYSVDPYFHYHKPEVDKYFYPLDNPRSQNDGISRNFEYDAIVTGTSMTENIRTTEVDELFGVNSIKVPYSGGSFKEVNDNIERALSTNSNITTIIRCLDLSKILTEPDAMRFDLGEYPTYLYDDNPFNDVEYLLNRDVLFGRVYKMISERNTEGFYPGITSFDNYTRWQESHTFGFNSVCPNNLEVKETQQIHLTDEERVMIKENVTQNVVAVADRYPDVEFYYFYSPYSVATWNVWNTRDSLYKQLESEAYATELILQHDNIHLFSINTRIDIISDLNNYKDGTHFGGWVNSLILHWMHDGQYQLTRENYKEYLQQEYDIYTTFDYLSVNGQNDYEADLYAAALLNNELTGAEPLNILETEGLGTSVVNTEFTVDLDDGYNYLSFVGQRIADGGHFEVSVYDENGEIVNSMQMESENMDDEAHQYVMDLSTTEGRVNIILQGDFGNASECRFSEVYMY